MEVFRAPPQTWKSFLLSVTTLSAIFIFSLFYVLLVPLLLYFYAWSMYFWIFAVTIISTVWWHHLIPSLKTQETLEYWRCNRVFEAWRSYFNFSIFKSPPTPSPTEKKEEKKTLYTFVPHGLFPFGLALISGILWKGKSVKIGIASTLLYIPVFGLLLRLLGCVEANKEIFSEGKEDIILVPDGIAWAFHSDRKNECLYLRNRKGFIRQALIHGYDIVPVYCFGHTQLYDVYGWQEMSRRLQFALVLFVGRNPAIWLPHARPVSVVIGKRITIPIFSSHISIVERERMVDRLHWDYLKEVKFLYDEYRGVVPEWDKGKDLKIL